MPEGAIPIVLLSNAPTSLVFRILSTSRDLCLHRYKIVIITQITARPPIAPPMMAPIGGCEICLVAATVTVGEGLEATLVVPLAATGLKVGLRLTGAG